MRTVGEHTPERQILNLLSRYAELVDAGDFDAVAELFAHGTYGPGLRGREVADSMRALVIVDDQGSPRTKHVVTNVIIEPEEDDPGGAGSAIRSRSYFTVLQATDGLALQPILTGRYADTFTSDGGVWRFAERRIEIDQVGDLSQHVRIDLRPTGSPS